jgi:hypothetical protein
MIEESLARLRAHRQNIDHYRRLLRTELAVIERDFIARRIAEEEAAMSRLADDTFPLVFDFPDARAAEAA